MTMNRQQSLSRDPDHLGPAIIDMIRSDPVTCHVSGTSMVPALNHGQRLELRPRGFYLPGEIVAYWTQRHALVIHRVIGYRPGFRRLRYVTQGDNLATSDVPVEGSQIVGRVCNVEINLIQRIAAILNYFRYLSRSTARHIGGMCRSG